MTDADKKPFVTLLTGLASAFRVELDEAGFEGYWLVLADLEMSAVRAAATIVARRSKFMPSAAEIREAVVEQMEHEKRVARIDRRRREFALSTSIDIARDELRLGHDERQIATELDRVGAGLGILLPWPTKLIEEQRVLEQRPTVPMPPPKE